MSDDPRRPPSPYGTPPPPQPRSVVPLTGSFPPAPPSQTQLHSQTQQRPVYRTENTAAVPSISPGGAITVQYPQVGSILRSPRGSYAIQRVLGSGAFGAVYEGVGPFDQTYALKMVRPANRPYSQVQAEWSKEVQRLLSLRHPNVVYIYDAFEENYLFYLALERCDHSLIEMLGTPMQEGLVIELVRQILAAVQFLHDNDIVHDDLHPGNVLISQGERPEVKISDFGISHELRGLTGIRPNVVHHAIMAPEILATGYTTKQSDIYQLGLLMLWMLTGQPAIKPDAPYDEIVHKIGSGEPRNIAERLGTPLGALVSKMLRRREAFRYANARDVWADLRELEVWKTRRLFPPK